MKESSADMPAVATATAARAKQLRLASRALCDAIRTGGFRSLFRSRGMDFVGVREYVQGDDVRSIDWNVSARTARTAVKVFAEERELTVFLIIDRSLSVEQALGRSDASSSVAPSSRASSLAQAASALTFACEHLACPLGAIFFHGEIERVLPARPASAALLPLLESLYAPCEAAAGSALRQAITTASSLLHSRSLVVILSDFRVARYEAALAHLAREHDVVALRIVDALDEELPSVGTIAAYDPETRQAQLLPTGNRAFCRRWQEAAEKQSAQWVDACLRSGAHPAELHTGSDALSTLIAFFSARQRMSL